MKTIITLNTDDNKIINKFIKELAKEDGIVVLSDSCIKIYSQTKNGWKLLK